MGAESQVTATTFPDFWFTSGDQKQYANCNDKI